MLVCNPLLLLPSDRSSPDFELTYSHITGAILLPACMFWFAWTVQYRERLHWMASISSTFFWGLGQGRFPNHTDPALILNQLNLSTSPHLQYRSELLHRRFQHLCCLSDCCWRLLPQLDWRRCTTVRAGSFRQAGLRPRMERLCGTDSAASAESVAVHEIWAVVEGEVCHRLIGW